MKPEDEDIQRLSRLYKLTVHVNEPNLFFVGMAKYGPHFRLSNFQSQLVSAILTKNCSLPHKEAMLKDIEEDFRAGSSRQPHTLVLPVALLFEKVSGLHFGDGRTWLY